MLLLPQYLLRLQRRKRRVHVGVDQLHQRWWLIHQLQQGRYVHTETEAIQSCVWLFSPPNFPAIYGIQSALPGYVCIGHFHPHRIRGIFSGDFNLAV